MTNSFGNDIDYSSSISAKHKTPPHSPCLSTNAWWREVRLPPMEIDECFYPLPQRPKQERATLQSLGVKKVVLYTAVEAALMPVNSAGFSDPGCPLRIRFYEVDERAVVNFMSLRVVLTARSWCTGLRHPRFNNERQLRYVMQCL